MPSPRKFFTAAAHDHHDSGSGIVAFYLPPMHGGLAVFLRASLPFIVFPEKYFLFFHADPLCVAASVQKILYSVCTVPSTNQDLSMSSFSIFFMLSHPSFLWVFLTGFFYHCIK